MARKKVKLAWIANESARKATFKKRRKGLMKKVRELSVLCDVKACAVVYAPNEAQLAVEVWPSEAEAAMRLLQRFKSIPEMEKTKKMMNQESFLRHLIAKLQEQLHKQEKENREMETRLFMYRALASGTTEGADQALHAMTIQDVTCLAWLVEVKVKAVQERLDLLLKGRMPKVEQDVEKEKVAVTASAAAAEATTAMRLNIEGEIQAQEWFMRAMMTNPPQPQENVNYMAAGFMGEGLNLMQMQMQMQPQYVDDHYGMDSFLDSLFSH